MRVLTEEQKRRKAEYNKKWFQNNKEKFAQYSAKYYDANKEKVAATRAKYHERNKETLTTRALAWLKANPAKSAINTSKWRRANADKVAAKAALRRALRVKATPVWADDFVIEEAYALARLRTKTTGVAHHVDHIVPLISRLVCGLHCEFNLQVIPGIENITKNNRYWPGMP